MIRSGFRNIEREFHMNNFEGIQNKSPASWHCRKRVKKGSQFFVLEQGEKEMDLVHGSPKPILPAPSACLNFRQVTNSGTSLLTIPHYGVFGKLEVFYAFPCRGIHYAKLLTREISRTRPCVSMVAMLFICLLNKSPFLISRDQRVTFGLITD